MQQLTQWLGDLAGAPAYGAVALLVFCEVAVPFGFLLPGETSVVLGGVLAQHGRVSVAAVAAVAAAAAVAGDSAGYLVGRLTGGRLREAAPRGRNGERLRRAERLMERHGAAAVFAGRLVPFVRSAVPLLAGAARMPYGRFLLVDALAGLVWGTGSALLGYAAGAAWSRAAHAVGGSLLVLLAAACAAALAVRRYRGGRDGRESAGPAPEEGCTGGPGPRRTPVRGPAAAADRTAAGPDAGRRAPGGADAGEDGGSAGRAGGTGRTGGTGGTGSGGAGPGGGPRDPRRVQPR
ncbi:DedA family protein [Streptacidiphilus sp. ASG 303]|uniref:DedA family protein n=1 Tax=Streptacidiphilus sp. ASG 303 TaxID=2896847 RepID=UPI001E3379E9|nr:DedA family protein [Streptacidiphilus sp. ASG 303]MCD0482574.1 DedA family protein [Streptacidiphilus sp. ASG 303]